MNICVVTPRYPFGGDSEFVFVKKLVDEWANMGHTCVVITPFSRTAYIRGRISYRPKHYTDDLGHGREVQIYNPRYNSYGICYKGISLDYLNANRAIEKQIQITGIKYDLIYCHFFSSALIAFRYALNNNMPFFFATGESTIGVLKKPYPGFEWAVFREYTKGIVAVSSKNKEEAVSRGYIDVSKCDVFPNGTDTKLFKPLDKIECRKKLHMPLDDFIISCVGYICERKGQNRLLEAVRRIGEKGIKLIFIGSEAKMESFTLTGDEILFKGRIDNADLPIYLNASDVFCLPTRAEGCCNAIIEALACGLPVISSDLPFNKDVLDETNSILIDPNNIEEISDAIVIMRRTNCKLGMLAESPFNRSELLDIHNRAERIINFIRLKI